MIRLVGAVAVVVAGVLLLTEVSMQPSGAERLALTGIYVLAAVITLGTFLAGRMVDRRMQSMGASLQLVAIASAAVAGIAVLLAAQTMFLSVHDRNLVLAALVLGVGLGSALAIAFGRRVGEDLDRVCEAAERVAGGEFSARVDLERRDEVGRMAAMFDHMAARLQATEEERAVLLASVGHDLRTPIASLQATIEAIEDGVLASDDRALGGMQKDIAHLSRLVEDLFLFARTEAGTVDLRLEPVDLAELADETAEVLGNLGRTRGITVEAVTGGPVTVEADPWALGRVFRNLVDNAIRHSPQGGTVRLVVETDASVTVEDEGPGFAPEIREVAFDRFSRDDAARTRNGGGAGLGLAIARGLVEAQGGHIAIVDGPGGRVRISL